MKKEWNAPMMEELTIKATAGRGHRPGDYRPGDSDVCRCGGGTSPCNHHHNQDQDPEERFS